MSFFISTSVGRLTSMFSLEASAAVAASGSRRVLEAGPFVRLSTLKLRFSTDDDAAPMWSPREKILLLRTPDVDEVVFVEDGDEGGVGLVGHSLCQVTLTGTCRIQQNTIEKYNQNTKCNKKL